MEVWPDQLPPSYEIIRDKIKNADGLVSLLTDKIDGPLLDAAPQLKVVSNFAVGFNNIDIPVATERGVAVGNTPGVLTDATADMGMVLLLSASRRLVEGVDDAKAGLEDMGAGRLVGAGPRQPDRRHRRHGADRLRVRQALPFRLEHEGALYRR